MSSGRYCTVVYDGKHAPEHLAKRFLLKGVEFATGEQVDVPATMAGLLLKSAPQGTVSVVAGEPEEPDLRTSAMKAEARRRAEHLAQFPADPAKLLADLATLPAEVRKALGGKEDAAIAFLDAGSADAILGNVALWARLSGLDPVAKAALRRREALTRAEPNKS